MSYMLIELSTGNVIGFFPTERDALQEVADSITEDGIDSVETLGSATTIPLDRCTSSPTAHNWPGERGQCSRRPATP